MVGKALGGQEVTISKRNVEFVYSKDAAKSAVLACHQNGLEDRIFNVGSGNIWAAEQIGSILTEIIPGTSVLYSEPGKSNIISRPDEVAMDLTRAKEQLGYSPEFPMENEMHGIYVYESRPTIFRRKIRRDRGRWAGLSVKIGPCVYRPFTEHFAPAHLL